MWEERLAIMKLVQEGKLSVEEAAALLEALEEEEAADLAGGPAEVPEAGPAAEAGGTGDAAPRGSPGWADAMRDLERVVGRYVTQFVGGIDRERAQEIRERFRSELKEAMEQVREQAREVRERVRDEVRGALREAREQAGEAREQAREAMREAREAARGAAREAGDVAGDVAESVRDAVGSVEDAGRGWGLGEILGQLFGAGLGPRQTVVRAVEGHFEGDGPVTVDLASTNGPITVHPADGPAFRLKATVTLPADDQAAAEARVDEDLEISTGPDSLRVGLRREGEIIRAGLRIECWLPRNRRYRLRVRTVNGHTELRDLEGEALEARSVNGSVRLTGVRARDVQAKTANGSVRVEGQARNLEATTANGSVEVVAPEPWELTGEGRWSLRTANGSIRAYPPAGGAAGVKYEASSLNGRIRVDLPGHRTEIRGHRYGRMRRAAGETEGFAQRPFRLTLEARTTNGAIEVAVAGAASASA